MLLNRSLAKTAMVSVIAGALMLAAGAAFAIDEGVTKTAIVIGQSVALTVRVRRSRRRIDVGTRLGAAHDVEPGREPGRRVRDERRQRRDRGRQGACRQARIGARDFGMHQALPRSFATCARKVFAARSTASRTPARVCSPKNSAQRVQAWSWFASCRKREPESGCRREMLLDAQAAKIAKPNVYMVEGYIAARTFAEALRRIPKDPTRARLKKAIEGLDNVNLGGFRVHFADERVGSKLVELSLIDSQGKVRE